mgnify:CR=1 FL=1
MRMRSIIGLLSAKKGLQKASSTWCVLVMTITLSLLSNSAQAQSMKRGIKQIVQSGIIQRNDSLLMVQDSLDNLSKELIKQQRKEAKHHADSLSRIARRKARAEELGRLDPYQRFVLRLLFCLAMDRFTTSSIGNSRFSTVLWEHPSDLL